VDGRFQWAAANAQGRCEPLTVRDKLSGMVLENRALGGTKTATVKPAFAWLRRYCGM
jgi:hypothetical protein